MKTIRKSTTLLAVLSLMLTLWAPVSVSAETATDTPAATEPLPYAQPQRDDVLYAGGELLERLDNGEALRYIYDHIIDGLVSGQDGVDIPLNGYTITEDELKVVRSVLNAIVPDYYGKGTGEFLYSDLNDTLYEDRLSCQFWPFGYGNHPEIEAQVYQRVNDLTHDLADKSDYEKSRILFERLVCVNYYEETPNDQTAYGALVEGKSVCSGYARAYQLLMQAVGIPCFYIVGFGGKEAHAWNLVRLDGQWYYSDPTWGDHTDTSIGINYRDLNCTYDSFVDGGHTFLEDWVPRTTATDANYYYRNCIECNTLTLQQMIDLLRVNNPLTLQITGDRDAIANLFWDNYETIAAAIGLEQWSTASCGYRYDQLLVLEILGEHTHNYQSFTIHPVCDAGGYTHHYCTECSDWYRDDATSLLGHDDTHYPAQTPSCVEQGWDAYTVCNRCGYSTQEKVWGDCTLEVAYVEPATCTRDGYTMYVCTLCHLGYLRDIVPALGHDMGIVPAKEPTCLESGWEAYEGCLRCGEGKREYVWGDHRWEIIEKRESTCTGQGYVHKRCTVCGREDFEYPAPTGHKMVSRPAKKPTCQEMGWDAYEECTVCGRTTKLFRWGDCEYKDTVVEPTCSEQGYTHHQCIYCGRQYDDTYVDRLEHTMIPRPAKEATCSEMGWDAYEECTVCGLDTKWPKWGDCQYEAYFITEPTCTDGGSIQSRCTLCGKYKIEPLNHLGHDMVTRPAKEATCSDPGWNAYEECTRCGENNRESFYGDCYYEIVEVVAPTCTEGGYSEYRCVGCHLGYFDDFTDPLGHNLEEELSYNENGHGNLCRNCNKLQNFERHYHSCDVCGYGKPTVTPGDANGDDKVNNRDLGLLQRHLNGWSVDINLEACDVNGDGKVNNRDLAMLQKQLNT